MMRTFPNAMFRPNVHACAVSLEENDIDELARMVAEEIRRERDGATTCYAVWAGRGRLALLRRTRSVTEALAEAARVRETVRRRMTVLVVDETSGVVVHRSVSRDGAFAGSVERSQRPLARGPAVLRPRTVDVLRSLAKARPRGKAPARRAAFTNDS
jgi:hypothetical protein